MVLLICPDCKRSVSDAAPACIHCGRPISHPGPGISRLARERSEPSRGDATVSVTARRRSGGRWFFAGFLGLAAFLLYDSGFLWGPSLEGAWSGRGTGRLDSLKLFVSETAGQYSVAGMMKTHGRSLHEETPLQGTAEVNGKNVSMRLRWLSDSRDIAGLGRFIDRSTLELSVSEPEITTISLRRDTSFHRSTADSLANLAGKSARDVVEESEQRAARRADSLLNAHRSAAAEREYQRRRLLTEAIESKQASAPSARSSRCMDNDGRPAAGYQTLVANVYPGKPLFLGSDCSKIGVIADVRGDYTFPDGTKRDAVLISFENGTADWVPRKTVQLLYVTR
jgi:hypothetical protein